MNDSKISLEKYILVDVKDTRESFKRTRIPDGPDRVVGNYIFIVEVTALTEDLYLPMSVASGKKPAGFVYQIEGTAEGSIQKTDISCRGEKVTQVTFGTIIYCKIPAGMTAAFRIRIETRGQVGKSYKIVISQIHFKLNPLDARYQTLIQNLQTKILKFS